MPSLTSVTTHIVSGIPDDLSGTGRLMRLLRQMSDGHSVQFYFRPPPGELKKLVKRFEVRGILHECIRLVRVWSPFLKTLRKPLFNRKDRVVFFHPQNFGMFKAFLFLLLRRSKTYYYLLDSSFFCYRSYNHLDQEDHPCLRCVGKSMSKASQFGCKTFPTHNWFSFPFFIMLKWWAKRGKIHFLAQNLSQADLCRQHFGTEVEVDVIGLWTSDFEGLKDSQKSFESDQCIESDFDVVLHSHYLPAKGAEWAYELAKITPELCFLFPCCPPPGKKVLANIRFEPMSWESGLAEAIIRARLVLVPSLWSAPIEGALVKSIFANPKVAVVENDSAFCSEIGSEVLLVLDRSVDEARKQILNCLAKEELEIFRIEARKKWMRNFLETREDFIKKIIGGTNGS